LTRWYGFVSFFSQKGELFVPWKQDVTLIVIIRRAGIIYILDKEKRKARQNAAKL